MAGTKKRANADDDFVLTLSDDENDTLNQLEEEGEGDDEDEDEEEEEDQGEDDGALNSDFEFDVGGAANEVRDFDGWEVNGNEEGKGGDKKAVDIDDIISRRQAKKEAELIRKQKKKQKQEEEFSELEDDDEEDGGMEVDFGDDELLAEDGFG
ncbi:hypothetical protein CAN33_0046865 [Aspergillus niger]|uniref:Uncharacterized protein n=1 Tax=Aspergillus niger TaxID=5061 RepID=A0A505IHY9_ASPNG|nr:hypothetical protein CAN33_0046865 [Aspergillus niger]